MEYLYNVISVIFVTIFSYLCFTSFYLFTIAFAGIFKRAKFLSQHFRRKRIAILVPCYKEDAIILDTVSNLQNHDYPVDDFKVFVIADSLQADTIQLLQETECGLIEVKLSNSTKAKSLHKALNTISSEQFDIALILDADNHLAPGCLEKINNAFHAGVRAVQCHRVAKNENTTLALLDAINEEINNILLRKGQWILGFSATASGSGMAFEFNVLKEIFDLPHILDNSSEDKEIDIQLMKRNIKMEYLEDARVLDEKAASFYAFKKQRLRWFEAYLNYVFRLFYKDLRKTFVKAEFWNRFFQLSVLPRSLYLITLFAVGLVVSIGGFYEFPFYHPSVWLWLLIASIYFITLVLCLPAAYINWRTVKSLMLLPMILLTMVITVARVKPGRKEFIHTPKSFTQP